MAYRRFPPPWSVEKWDACFVVKDHGGQKPGVCLFRGGAGRLQHDGDEPNTLVGVGVTGAPF